MARTTFEKLTDCDFEVFTDESLTKMLVDIQAEIAKRKKEAYDELFESVISAIDALLDEKMDCECFYDCSGNSYYWSEIKQELLRCKKIDSML